jgi:hypothetical protein
LQEVLQRLFGFAEGGLVFFGGQAVFAALPPAPGGHHRHQAVAHAPGLGLGLHVVVPDAGAAHQADGVAPAHRALGGVKVNRPALHDREVHPFRRRVGDGFEGHPFVALRASQNWRKRGISAPQAGLGQRRVRLQM